MKMDMGKDVVSCPHCKWPIALPAESPLGRFQGFADEYAPAEWPATFLCPRCGGLYVASKASMDDEVQVRGIPDDLVRVAYEAADENAVVQRIVYTTCPRGEDAHAETPRLIRRLPNVLRILTLHVAAYQDRDSGE